jgi:signal transduction histidine kinase
MEPAAGTHGSVLVLEDDAGINRLVRTHLERSGYRAVPALSTEEALQKLRSAPIDLLVLDYQLGTGEPTGLEFYGSLQKESVDCPAILITGFSDEERLAEALRAGMRDYILKTPNFLELVAPTVDRVMRQVRAERELIEAEAASRAKDHFFATLSHELRTPLTPVLALVSALRRDERLPQDVQEDLTTIARNIELEARLIDDMLDLTRIVRGKLELRLETIDIRPIIEHVVKNSCSHEAAEKSIACHVDLAEAGYVARVDRARLSQVIWNLLNNAIKFTPNGGTVWTRSRVEAVGECSWIIVEVQDSGMGIKPELLSRVFGAFEQGDLRITRQFGGLGLGLAICRAIVDLHGGTITASSPGVGQGATFTLRLPLCEAAPAADESGAPVSISAAAGSNCAARLLLVEDHPDTAQIMSRLLRRAGYEVTVAGSVAEGLAAAGFGMNGASAEPAPALPQLVVSDLGLPDGTGHDLMRQLRERVDVRGIALSGFGMEEDVQRARAAGFSRHLTKPVEFEALLDAIRELLAES